MTESAWASILKMFSGGSADERLSVLPGDADLGVDVGEAVPLRFNAGRGVRRRRAASAR